MQSVNDFSIDHIQKDQPKLLIIGGMMRGGSTLLHSILNSHTEICLFSRELRALQWSNLSGPGHALAVHRHLWAGKRRIADPHFRTQTYSYLWHLFHQPDILHRPVDIDTLVKVFSSTLAKPGCRYVGDKYPDYIFYYPLFNHHPDCRSIFIIRDPRDVVSSILFRVRNGDWSKQKWIKKYSSLEGAINYWIDTATVMADLSILNSHTLLIRYEDLVQTTEQSLNHIADYLKVNAKAFDQTIPHPRSLGKSADYLEAHEIHEIESKTAALMSHFNYV